MSDQEPELIFEPIEDDDEIPPAPPPRRAATPAKPPAKPPAARPPAPPPRPSQTAAATQPAAQAAPRLPPKAVQAEAELRQGFLQRDARGRVLGERFAVLCAGEAELLQALQTLSHILPLRGLRVFRAPGAELLEASGEGLAREMLSSRLDAAADAFRLGHRGRKASAGPRLFVGARGLFVPYTGSAAAWDIEGEPAQATPGEPPLLLGPGTRPMAFSEAPKEDLLPRLQPRPRFHQAGATRWLLTSSRLFRALRGFLQDAGLEFSFAALQHDTEGEQMLLHIPELRRAEQQRLAGLPEVTLLWDPQEEEDDDDATPSEVPALLLDQGLELALGRSTLTELTTANRPLIFRRHGGPLLLAGPLPLITGEALLEATLAEPPQMLRPQEPQEPPRHPPLRLELRLLRREETPPRRTRALLLTESDLQNLALLRDHLPWAVTQEAELARFGGIAFLLLGREARWNLPIGLPYWGDPEAGVYLVRGYVASPEVPTRVLRRAAQVAGDELAFLSPARLWRVPREAFAPLAESLELQRDLSRLRLDVKAASFERTPTFPQLKWPEEKEEKERLEIPLEKLAQRPIEPKQRRSLQQEAEAALAQGEHEKAANFYERAGEYRLAAELYDHLASQAAGAEAAPGAGS